MRLVEPKVQEISERVLKLTCPRFVAEFFKAHWKPENIQINYDCAMEYMSSYREFKQVVFVMPVSSVGHIVPGEYEYDEWPDTPSGLSQHVSGPETYVAQYCGGGGDRQYGFIKDLCDIDSAITDAMEYYGCRESDMVSKPVEGKKNVLTTVTIPPLAPMYYCKQMIPPIAMAEVVLWGDERDFSEIHHFYGSEESRDIKWFLEMMFAYGVVKPNKRKENENKEEEK